MLVRLFSESGEFLMANTKQRSAAQRRVQDRSNRQRQQNTSQYRGRRSQVKRSSGIYWWLGGIVGLVVVIIAIIVVVGNIDAQQAQQNSGQAYKAVTTIPAATFARADTGSVSSSPMTHVKSAPVLKGPDGKPEILYVGGEYCPYCAAQRYVVLAALSRFGTFKNVSPITASEGSISTFTFEGSSYSSNYISLDAKEAYDNNQQPLDTLNAQDSAVVNTYNKAPYVSSSGAGGIPFMSIANQYVSVSSYYDNTLLAGKSYAAIASQLGDSSSDIGRGVLGGANYLTAAICSVTNNQPANVCSASYIPALQQAIQKTTVQQETPGGNGALAQAVLPTAIDVPRRS